MQLHSEPHSNIKIAIYFEDEHCAVIHKPAGFHVSGNRPQTIRSALPSSLSKTDEASALIQPEPMHRLDRRTSGLLIIAKTSLAAQKITQQFEQGLIHKTYRAIVLGRCLSGCSQSPIDKKAAFTKWDVKQHTPSLRCGHITDLLVYPKTGRTHQIRRHLQEVGHPILGDDLYHNGLVRTDKGLFLSAVGLSFRHPTTSAPISINIDPPQKFTTYQQRELRRHKAYYSS